MAKDEKMTAQSTRKPMQTTPERGEVFQIDDPLIPRSVTRLGRKQGRYYVAYIPGCWQLMNEAELVEYRNNLAKER